MIFNELQNIFHLYRWIFLVNFTCQRSCSYDRSVRIHCLAKFILLTLKIKKSVVRNSESDFVLVKSTTHSAPICGFMSKQWWCSINDTSLFDWPNYLLSSDVENKWEHNCSFTFFGQQLHFPSSFVWYLIHPKIIMVVLREKIAFANI